MKRIIIIHGRFGSPHDNWLPWLTAKLRKLEHDVLVPEMPDADRPVIGPWVNHLTQVVGKPDSQTYFVGHSVGCQTILRYLETIDEPVGGAVFVAGWFNLENMKTDEEREIAKPWIETPIDLANVASVLPQSTLIISDNDDYGAFEENRKKFSEVVTKEVILSKAEHIVGPEYPEILAEVGEMVG